MNENGPDLNALARDMLDYQLAKRHLDELEQAIKDTILQLGETVVTGTVRATYSGGRRTFDYQGAAEAHRALQGPTGEAWYFEVLEACTTQPAPKTNWKQVVSDLDLTLADIPVKTQGKPSVTLKVTA